MTDKTILHVTVGPVSDRAITVEELERMTKVLREGFEDWEVDDEYEAIVTGPDVDIEDVTEKVKELV